MMCSPKSADAFEKSCLCCVKPSSACLLPPKRIWTTPISLPIFSPFSLSYSFSFSFYSFILLPFFHSSIEYPFFILLFPQVWGVCSANLSRAWLDGLQDCIQAFNPSLNFFPTHSRPVVAHFEAIATFTVHNVSLSPRLAQLSAKGSSIY